MIGTKCGFEMGAILKLDTPELFDERHHERSAGTLVSRHDNHLIAVVLVVVVVGRVHGFVFAVRMISECCAAPDRKRSDRSEEKIPKIQDAMGCGARCFRQEYVIKKRFLQKREKFLEIMGFSPDKWGAAPARFKQRATRVRILVRLCYAMCGMIRFD